MTCYSIQDNRKATWQKEQATNAFVVLKLRPNSCRKAQKVSGNMQSLHLTDVIFIIISWDYKEKPNILVSGL